MSLFIPLRQHVPQTGPVYLGYSRISDQDRDAEISIDIQNERLLRAGVHCCYADQISGNTAERPGYQELLRDCETLTKQGRQVEIWACRLDRLGRDDRELERCIEWLESVGAKFKALESGYYGTQDLYDWMRLKQEAMMAQFWVRQTSAAVRRRNAEKRAQGIPTCKRPPKGYKFNADLSALEIDPETVPQVRSWFERYMAGEAMSSIGRDIGVPGSSVKQMLANPVYRGHLQSTKGGRTSKQTKGRKFMTQEITYNTHPAIITESEWRQVQRRMSENKRLWGRNFKTKRYQLQGLVVCVECGHKTQTIKTTTRHGKTYLYMRCNAAYNGACSNRKLVSYPAIEAAIQEKFVEVAEAIAETYLKPKDMENPLLLEKQRELETLKPLSNRPAIAAEIKVIEAEIAQIQNTGHIVEASSLERETAITDLAKSSPEDWKDLAPEYKKEIYADLVKSVAISDGEIVGIELFD